MTSASGIGRLRAQLATLQRELIADVERLRELQTVQSRASEIDTLLTDLKRQLERLDQPAVITLVGATGAGKSTLLNALAGGSVAREGVDRPTTSEPVIHAPEAAELGALLREFEGAPAACTVSRHGHTQGPASQQILIDAPDWNSIAQEHRETVRKLAEHSDVLLVVMHRQSIVEEASVSFLDAFRARRRMVFVLNRCDELTPDARQTLRKQLIEMARERWRAPQAPVHWISARQAQTEAGAEGFAALLTSLDELVREATLEQVRRDNALGIAERLEQLFGRIGDDSAADFDDLPAQIEAGWKLLSERTAAEVGERLRLKHADLSALLWSEAAKRWDGPGGWALRTGGLTSMGLGAGALLARRNPLLAAGAAAGGMALGKIQAHTRERRVSSAESLLPGRTEMEAWYQEGLAEARIRAGRLLGDADALVLPELDEVVEDTRELVEEAWSRLVDRDLPALAETCIPAWLRWTLDTPVYAMALFVIYKAIVGFFTSEYVGLDFLLNAMLLLLAYLFVVRLGIRRGLRGRATALLQNVIAGLAESLGAKARKVSATATGELKPLQEASTRMQSLGHRWREQLGSRD